MKIVYEKTTRAARDVERDARERRRDAMLTPIPGVRCLLNRMPFQSEPGSRCPHEGTAKCKHCGWDPDEHARRMATPLTVDESVKRHIAIAKRDVI